MLFAEVHGTEPDLIYAMGVPGTPTPDLISFDTIAFILIIIEIGLCKDLGCDNNITEKTDTYSPVVKALKEYRGRVDFAAVPIGHAGTTLYRTQDHLMAAFSAVGPLLEQVKANKGATSPVTNFNSKPHDYRMFNLMLDSLRDLAQSQF